MIRGIQHLETPVPLVDLTRLECNLDRMAAYAEDHGLALRPHAKTHKSPHVAAEQLRRGAVGITCATPLEAEVMASVSSDVLLAYPPVGPAKIRRLLELPATVTLTVALDSVMVAEQLARTCIQRGRTVGVYLELDTGMHRVGLSAPEDILVLARRVAGLPGLAYRGIAFYPGHIRMPVGRQDAELQRLDSMITGAIRVLQNGGMAPPVVSGGSTPTVWRTHEITGVTEFRPGTYVYNDRTTVEVGACAGSDCALTVLATIVSTAVPGQAVVDAGSKALGREPCLLEAAGFGALLDRPEVTVQRLSEEHGILDLSTTGWRPSVGEHVRIVPNHACIAVHLHETMYGVRGDQVETSWPVTARGRQPLGRFHAEAPS